MSYKRSMWTSGLQYRTRCMNCGTFISYTDNQLGYRSWFPNGFVYCPTCRKPIRHEEYYAVKPDGSPVFSSRDEANRYIVNGYYAAMGVQPPYDPNTAAQTHAQPQQPASGAPNVAYCTNCGKPYHPGVDNFCSGCGNKL